MLDINFEYKALFYNDAKYKYRRYLEIRNKEYNEENDLTVVMMNPGSSKPKMICCISSVLSVSARYSKYDIMAILLKPSHWWHPNAEHFSIIK